MKESSKSIVSVNISADMLLISAKINDFIRTRTSNAFRFSFFVFRLHLELPLPLAICIAIERDAMRRVIDDDNIRYLSIYYSSSSSSYSLGIMIDDDYTNFHANVSSLNLF